MAKQKTAEVKLQCPGGQATPSPPVGPALGHLAGADIVTDPLLPGAVQVPGSGQPIVLMVDCQTAGGYARIGTVIGPDVRLLAQARAGDQVRFHRVGPGAALRALREERAALATLARRLARR